MVHDTPCLPAVIHSITIIQPADGSSLAAWEHPSWVRAPEQHDDLREYLPGGGSAQGFTPQQLATSGSTPEIPPSNHFEWFLHGFEMISLMFFKYNPPWKWSRLAGNLAARHGKVCQSRNSFCHTDLSAGIDQKGEWCYRWYCLIITKSAWWCFWWLATSSTKEWLRMAWDDWVAYSH